MDFFARVKSPFQEMIPLAPALPRGGRGRIAMPRYYLNWTFPGDCVQVLRHNRNREMPLRQEHDEGIS